MSKLKTRRAVCGYCFLPMVWPDAPKGKRRACPECDAMYMTGTTLRSGTIFHRIFKEGTIPSNIDERAGAVYRVDQVKDKRKALYLTCPNCASICEADPFEVFDDGYVGGHCAMSCITCRRCEHHFWPYLEGWAEKGPNSSESP